MTMAAETKLKPTERPLLSGPPNNVYRVISGWVHFAMSTYYRIITVGGLENLPPDRGCIIAANHWNMAVDVGALIESCPRKVHFWTKAELFNGPPGVSRFMNAMGCLPVKRNSRSGKKESNEALFQSTVETLLKGGVIAIFPEGTSHHTPQLTELKDGASWAALQFAAAVSDPNDIAPIVPVGIIYEPNKSTWRSNVHVQYGKAVDVTPYLKEFAADPRAAVKRLTSALHAALETVTINAPNWETLHMAKDAQYIALGKGRAQSDVQVISRLIKAVSTDKPEAAQLKSQAQAHSLFNWLYFCHGLC
ncbi:hypothetical protein BC832DRAFT_129703 [Gaertneriomyces semiglobifer]|nr:hypothetical protein BC832DRAFT_129703 [Gaertneriomyces semiglobifer]